MAQGNRHSTIVAWAKVILPIVGILLLSSLFLFSQSPDPDAALPFADVDVEQIARDQRLSQPRFAGTLEDGREVTVVSDTATPSPDDPNRILLDQIEARLEITRQDYVLLTAQSGRIDTSSQLAHLQGGVRLLSSHGYRLSSEEMNMSLADLRLVSPGPVVASGPGFDLEAGSMEVVGPDQDAVLSFTNGVRLVYGARE